MISRFFKKKPKPPEPKKPTSVKATFSNREAVRSPHKKILTAEGWKRLMMPKSGKKK